MSSPAALKMQVPFVTSEADSRQQATAEHAATSPSCDAADENTPDAAITRQEIAMLLDGPFDGQGER